MFTCKMSSQITEGKFSSRMNFYFHFCSKISNLNSPSLSLFKSFLHCALLLKSFMKFRKWNNFTYLEVQLSPFQSPDSTHQRLINCSFSTSNTDLTLNTVSQTSRVLRKHAKVRITNSKFPSGIIYMNWLFVCSSLQIFIYLIFNEIHWDGS